MPGFPSLRLAGAGALPRGTTASGGIFSTALGLVNVVGSVTQSWSVYSVRRNKEVNKLCGDVQGLVNCSGMKAGWRERQIERKRVGETEKRSRERDKGTKRQSERNRDRQRKNERKRGTHIEIERNREKES